MSRQYLEQRLQAFGTGDKLAAFILEHGNEYQIGPHTYEGRRRKMQQCFCNATHLMLEDPKRLTYVEGYVSTMGIPIQHAWVIDQDGIVIDPTIRKPFDRISDYFGVAFSARYIEKTIMVNGYYGVFDYMAFKTLPDLIEGKVDFKPKTEPRSLITS